jgi:predicted transcriptional regulator
MNFPCSDQTIRLRTKLRRLHLAAGVTKTELARCLGKPQSYTSKAESGDFTLDLLDIRDFCTAYDLNFAKFTQKLDEQLTKLMP